MGMCCRGAEGKALPGEHGRRARRKPVRPLSACMAFPSPYSLPRAVYCFFAHVAVAYSAGLPVGFVCKSEPLLQSIMHAIKYHVYAGYLLCLATRHCKHGAGMEQAGQGKLRASAMRSESAQRVPNALHRQAGEHCVCAEPLARTERTTGRSSHAQATNNAGMTKYCIASGTSPLSLKYRGLSTSGGHPSTTTERLCTSAARSGTSCCQVYTADRQSAPPAGWRRETHCRRLHAALWAPQAAF